jgi:hypothetical protein
MEVMFYFEFEEKTYTVDRPAFMINFVRLPDQRVVLIKQDAKTLEVNVVEDGYKIKGVMPEAVIEL